MWHKKSTLSEIEPNVPVITEFAKRIGADLVLMYRCGWQFTDTMANPQYAYLIDVRNKRIYTTSKTFVMLDCCSPFEVMTKELLDLHLSKAAIEFQKLRMPGFGQVWQKYSANPLASAIGAPGSWNSAPPTYILVEGHAFWDSTEYKGYFGGTNGRTYSIGLITSPSLESGWTVYSGNPVLTAGAFGEWDEKHVGNAMVIKDEGIYKMWYAGTDANGIERIGYATSRNGITWTKHVNNPVLEPDPGTWEDSGVFGPYVIKEGDTYKMWYSGWVDYVGGSTGYAISPDGINWAKSGENPVLEHGAPGAWDQALVACPVVIHDEDKYLMWYLGEASFDVRTALPQTGFAMSYDGIHWTKDSTNNPILRVSAGQWDAALAGVGQVFKEGNTYKMLYGGADLATFFGMGLAVLFTPTKP
jgi:predicted GH43/DUF377 family glycosyl hydrolase